MLERLTDLPGDIEGIKATGTVSSEDFDEVFEPLLEEARRDGRRIPFLYQFGPGFEGFTARGVWEDARIGLGTTRRFVACAVVSDTGWIKKSASFVGHLLPYPVRVFSLDERQAAIEWLGEQPASVHIDHRLIEEAGVLAVEVDGPLQKDDFDDLTATADSWIASHGGLDGLVIHAERFPGWEDLGSVIRHVQFVRDHHRKVGRVAFASDSKLAALAPRIAEHFVNAEIKQFDYDAVDAAIEWAGGG